MKILIFATLVIGISGTAAEARVYRLAEMNTTQITALDKNKTAVIMPGGILEQHGPYLPSYSDGYMNEWWAERLADEIVERPGWSAVIFPAIPLGQSGANDIGGKNVFPGTYSVHAHTLRSVFMDLASELGEQGFKWVFVMHAHGSPMHNLMLDQAGDYFRDEYNGRMVNLFGMLAKPTKPGPVALPDEDKEDGAFKVHAGMTETSNLIFLRPDLVPLSFLSAKPFTANSMDEAVAHGRADGWPGYIGSPRLANASFGARLMKHHSAEMNAIALAILDGLDERTIPRLSVVAFSDKATAEVLAGSDKHWSRIEQKQAAWLKKNSAR